MDHPTHSFVSHSDVTEFKRCRQAWDFSSALRKGLQPVTTARALQLGTMVHQLLEWYYAGNTDADQLSERLRSITLKEHERLLSLEIPREAKINALAQLEAVTDKAAGIMTNYLLWCRKPDQHLRPVATEHNWQVPIITTYGETLQVLGTFDAIFEDVQTQSIWINDFKVTGSGFDWYGEYVSFYSSQARMYAWAAKKLFPDYKVAGVMFTLIKNEPPRRPKLLQKGGLSRAANQNTTWDLYKRTLQELNLPVEAYADMEATLMGNEFIRRVQIHISDDELLEFQRHMSDVAALMVDPNVPIYPSPDFFSCQRCAFKDPCRGVQTQNQTLLNYLLRNNYRQSEYAQKKLAQLMLLNEQAEE